MSLLQVPWFTAEDARAMGDSQGATGILLDNLGPALIGNISKNVSIDDGRDGSLIRQSSSVRSVRGPSHFLLDVWGFPPWRLQEPTLLYL